MGIDPANADRRIPTPGAVLVRSRDLTVLGNHASCADYAAIGFVNIALATVLVDGTPTTCP